MLSASKIDFTKLDPIQFEALIFKLIKSSDFSNVRWNQGSADDGRDFEAIKIINNDIVGVYKERWFFEAKHHSKGVRAEKLNSKIAWADSEMPNHLVIFLSTHITNSAKNWLQGIKEKKNYYIHIVQGNELKEILINKPKLINEFNLIEGYYELINVIKSEWIVDKKISHWSKVISATTESNRDIISFNEKVLLGSLMTIQFFSINSWSNEEENEYSEMYDVILNQLNIEFKTKEDKSCDFFEEQKYIEWIDEKNYGMLEVFEDDYYPTAFINFIKYKNTLGFLGILKGFDNNKYILYPYFLAQDSSLTLTMFRPIESNIE